MPQHKAYCTYRSFLLMIVTFASCASVVTASDHADPIDPFRFGQPDGRLTGLFAFPSQDGEKLVIVVCIHPSLNTPNPVGTDIELVPFKYTINIDTHSHVRFDDPDTLARYGGDVLLPAEIRPDVIIEIRLSNEAELTDLSISGLSDPNLLTVWTGIRDDPFILYGFQSFNVIAVVLEIPFDQFRAGQNDFLIWATSSRFGQQVDHVGRALRTMLPRFDFLNTLPPAEHVQAIQDRHTSPGVLPDLMATFVAPLFGIRHYDFEPDVMIYSRRFPSGYPNGRRLQDDVAKLCCEQGDCLLWETSLADAHAEYMERPSKNDKPFSSVLPYLAEPNDARAPAETPWPSRRTSLILFAVVIIVLTLILLPWFLWWKSRKTISRIRRSVHTTALSG